MRMGLIFMGMGGMGLEMMAMGWGREIFVRWDGDVADVPLMSGWG